jgi:4-alpha-glucanotransferase
LNTRNDGHDVLYELAQAAGISPKWHDHRGELRIVSPDVLRAVLASLELSADTPEQCQESLEQIRVTEQRRVPSLITGRSNQQLTLPVALQCALGSHDIVHLKDDDGDVVSVRLENDPEGKVCLPAGIGPGYYVLEAGSIQTNLAIAPPHCSTVPERTGQPHNFGLAAQIYSLRTPGDGGIGSFSGLRDFARVCGEKGAQALAISPVHALFSADKTRYSPYAPSSRLFLNALYVDPAAVLGSELVNQCIKDQKIEGDLRALEQTELIDWPKAAETKLSLLRCIWDAHCAGLMAGDGDLGRDFLKFRENGGSALEQHAIFEAIHAQQFGQSPERWHWKTWPEALQHPGSSAVKQFAHEHRNEVGFHAFLQWLAAEGLADAQKAGKEAGLGVGLIADLAIGTDSGGSHAWSRQAEMLNGLSVGAPPDLINHQGQNWGLTTFSPRALMAHDYQPFIEMLRASLRYAGGLRIDHILGLRRLWIIPEGAAATDGAYLSFPQQDLLNLIALESWRHKAVIVGEDLGTVPEGFRDEISEIGILGMQVLWFEKDHGLFVDPSRWRTNAMATTTTHDLPTVAGWWKARDIEWNRDLDRFPEGRTYEDELGERAGEREALWAALTYSGVAEGDLPNEESSAQVVDSAIDFVASTESPLTVIPVEDILGIEEQPNLPGTTNEHPNWRRRLPMAVPDVLENDSAEKRLSILRNKVSTKRT